MKTLSTCLLILRDIQGFYYSADLYEILSSESLMQDILLDSHWTTFKKGYKLAFTVNFNVENGGLQTNLASDSLSCKILDLLNHFIAKSRDEHLRNYSQNE